MASCLDPSYPNSAPLITACATLPGEEYPALWMPACFCTGSNYRERSFHYGISRR